MLRSAVIVRIGPVAGVCLVLALGFRPPATVIAPEHGASDAGVEEVGSSAYAMQLELATAGGDRDRALAELRRGMNLSRGGDADAATRAFRRAAEAYPGITDWANGLAADAAARAGDTAAVRRQLAAAGSSLAGEWGWRWLVAGTRAAGDLAGAAEAAEWAARHVEDGTRRASAWNSAGDLRLARGDSAAARLAWLAALDAAPSTSAAVEAARRLAVLRSAEPDDRLRAGRILLRHGAIEAGGDAVRAWLRQGRGTAAERAEASLDIGRALFDAGRYRDAERHFAGLVGGSPREAAAEALLMTGRAQYRLKRLTEAQRTFARVGDRFPRSRAAAEALFILADLRHDEGEIVAAERYYRRAIAAWPGAEHAAQAAMRLGGLAFRAGRLDEAAEIFEGYRQAHGAGREFQQATYWGARTYFGLGERELARGRLLELHAADPVSYYGLLAGDLLGKNLLDAPLADSPESDEATRRQVLGGLARLDVLRALELHESAGFELARLKAHLAERPGGLYALAEELHGRGELVAAVRLGREIRQAEEGWNDRLLRIVYPLPYQELVEREARRSGIDPYLVAGLIRQESLFNPAAVSRAGALGLMQIMPATGRALARKEGIGKLDPEALRRPELNVRLGTRFLADLLAQYDGSLPEMLAAYNAGAGRVSRWRKQPEYGDPELFAERVPFQETRDYIRIVQQNARVYAALYGSAPGARYAAGERRSPSENTLDGAPLRGTAAAD